MKDKIQVSRSEYLKHDANMLAEMMRRANMKHVKVVGKRGNWVIKAWATAQQLAAFLSKEAAFDIKRRA